jgi:hypothetical protein
MLAKLVVSCRISYLLDTIQTQHNMADSYLRLTMKTLLFSGFLALMATSGANAQPNVLPIDSASQKVTFQGVVPTPSTTADELFTRAKAYAVGAGQPPLVEEAQKSVVSVWEKQITSGSGMQRQTRILRYQVRISSRDGRYRYELTDLQNKTMPVQYKDPLTQMLVTVPGGQAPVERVLANPDGYKKGKPTAALLAYQEAVRAAAAQAVEDLQQGMRGAGAGKEW